MSNTTNRTFNTVQELVQYVCDYYSHGHTQALLPNIEEKQCAYYIETAEGSNRCGIGCLLPIETAKLLGNTSVNVDLLLDGDYDNFSRYTRQKIKNYLYLIVSNISELSDYRKHALFREIQSLHDGYDSNYHPMDLSTFIWNGLKKKYPSLMAGDYIPSDNFVEII